MNKTDLVNAVAARTGFTKKDTGHAIDAMIGAISLAMKNGDSVTLAGFGTFKVTTRAARAGVNPRTREKMDIPARTSLRFHAAKALRDLVALIEPPAFVYDGTASGIMVLCGQGVTVSDGSLRFRNPDDENRVVFGQLSWTDYVVHVTAALAAGNGYGIYYRADGKAGFTPGITGYCFQFDRGLGRLVVRKVTDGSESEPFQSVPMPEPVAAALSSPHEISVAVEGSHHVISIDGAVVLDFYDDTFRSGMAGLRGWNGCDPVFGAVSVTLIPPAP